MSHYEKTEVKISQRQMSTEEKQLRDMAYKLFFFFCNQV